MNEWLDDTDLSQFNECEIELTKLRPRSKVPKQHQCLGITYTLVGSKENNKRVAEGTRRSWTPERRSEWSERQKSRVWSEETRSKISKAMKGRQFSDEARANMSAARQRSLTTLGSQSGKVIMTPYGEFNKLKLASEAIGVSVQTLINRMKRQPTEYYYTGQRYKEKTK